MINRLHAFFPPTIKDETPNPLTPWSISKGLFERLLSTGNQPFRKAVVLPSDPEWRFVWTAFSHDLPNRYMIRSISCIHNDTLAHFFEGALIKQDREATTCVASWQDEPDTDLRAKVMERWEAAAKLFSPFTTMEKDGRCRQWENVKVMPLWKGTKEENCESICETGFTDFRKSSSDPQTTDAGIFGSGIYFTNSARYAADIYSQGHLILSWVSMRTPFPVVSGDLKTLAGSAAYKNYNAHYAPVCAKNPGNPFEADYFPLKESDEPHCDNLVVFESAQALPRFWVTLELLDLYKKRLSQEPQFVEDLITHFYNLQLNSELDRDRRIRLILATFLAKLVERDPLDDLTDKELQWYEAMRNLFDASGKVQKAIRDQLIVLSGGKPQASETLQSPASSTSVAAPIQLPPRIPDYPSYLPAMVELEQEKLFGEQRITPNPASSIILTASIQSAPFLILARASQESVEEAISLPESDTVMAPLELSSQLQSRSDTVGPRAQKIISTPPRFLTHAEIEAENALGIKYRDGNGVPVDYKRAFQHFKIAADAGFAPAQSNCRQLLHPAAENGHKEVVELLLANGTKLNATNKYGQQPIHLAAERGYKEVVKLLLARGAKLNAVDGYDRQPIHLAAKSGHKEVVELLLAKGAKADAANKYGQMPIHLAAEDGYKEVVELLLARGANADAADKNGEQPILRAAQDGHKEVVEILLERGANADAADKNGEQPIHRAAQDGHKEVVELLLERGANADAADKNGWQPIHRAAKSGHKEIVELLLAKGAKVDAVDNCCEQPIHYAVQGGCKEVVELLLARKAKIDATDKDGWQPIHYAAWKGHKEVVEMLLAKGAKVNAADKNGEQPIHKAAQDGHKEVVELLLSKGAKANAADKKGRRPIQLAAKYGHTEIVELLHAHGAKMPR